MSYIHRRYGKGRGRASGMGLGDVGTTIAGIFSGAVNTAEDPYLPEVVCRFQQLTAINNHQAVPACNNTPDGLPGGVGLKDIVGPLRAYVYAKQNPWVFPAAIVAIFGVPFLLGYNVGRGRSA